MILGEEAGEVNPAELHEAVNILWGLSTPDALFSIPADATPITMPPALSQVLMTGLLQAAQITGGWFLTSGLDVGVAHLLGTYRRRLGNTNPCIGILALNRLQTGLEQRLLSAKPGSAPVRTNGDEALEPHHSHFLISSLGVPRGKQHQDPVQDPVQDPEQDPVQDPKQDPKQDLPEGFDTRLGGRELRGLRNTELPMRHRWEAWMQRTHRVPRVLLAFAGGRQTFDAVVQV